MTERDWLRFDQWHELFDALCDEAGHFDNATLASLYCAATGAGGQKQFDTALRNLNNWRTGRHIPHQRSLRVLAQMLKVRDDADLHRHWNGLYRKAKDIEGRQSVPVPAEDGVPAPRRWSTPQVAALGTVLFCLGAGSGMVAMSDWRPWGSPADDAPIVAYRPTVTLAVGQSRIIHGERGDCGKLPRAWDKVEASLPATRTGNFSDGGLVRRNSNFCQGLTPARGILFTATTPGTEEFDIQGDFIKMTVVEEGTQTPDG